MNFALVDDEPLQLEYLQRTLSAALDRLGMDDRQLDTYTDPAAFLDAYEEGRYDIVILDIYMGAVSGIDVARRIRETDDTVALAFCTSSNEFASQSYDVRAADYLQKPITEEKIARMLERFRLSSIERNRRLRLPDGLSVPLRSIIFTEYLNHTVRFHIKGRDPHTVRSSQGDIEALLTRHKGFYVINKGSVINFAQVRSLEANIFRMQNGETIPIARRRFKEIEAAYTRYIFERMEEEVND